MAQPPRSGKKKGVILTVVALGMLLILWRFTTPGGTTLPLTGGYLAFVVIAGLVVAAFTIKKTGA